MSMHPAFWVQAQGDSSLDEAMHAELQHWHRGKGCYGQRGYVFATSDTPEG